MKWNELQLQFDLDLDELAEDAQERAIAPDEARLISEAARVMFEGGQAEWQREYMQLREHGWPWRVAAYIAWASSPKDRRVPKTVAELATGVLGLQGPRVIYTWRHKYPSLDAVVAMMQAKPLFEHRRDVFDALVGVATQADYKGHNDRKLFFQMTGDFVPQSQIDLKRSGKGSDLSELSDDELAAMAGGFGEDVPASEDGADIDEVDEV